MNILTTVLTAILVFGFLIFIHEFGHYIFARIFRVSIDEFSIGMGPRLFYYDSKKTGIRYSLSMFPIGGFVAMKGENEESDDPNSFDKKPAWQRFIITAAGAAVNIVIGFLIILILVFMSDIGSTTVAQFPTAEETGYEISSADSGLMVGDTIVKVGNKNVRILDELSYEIMRNGHEPIDLTVLRDGEKIVLSDVVFPTLRQDGQEFGGMDFRVYRMEKDFGGIFTYAFRKAGLIIRMVWESLFDLITGRYTFAAVSGPVGISSAIGDAARAGIVSVLSITALISINLGVMNLLPIPALDGCRLLTLLIEMITRKRLPTKVEGMINGIGMLLLLGLSAVVLVKDVIQLLIY